MIEKKTVTTGTLNKPGVTSGHPLPSTPDGSFFHKENYKWMLAGAIVIIIGMFVMSGGKSQDPSVFDQKEVYSATRITIAPLLIVIGLGLEVFAIFRKPKA